MLFKLREKVYRFDKVEGPVEETMASRFRDLGYSVINGKYNLFHEAVKPTYPENEHALRDAIGEPELALLRGIQKGLYPPDLGPGIAPEQPDLFVFKEGDYFFSEVKHRNDYLREPQMAGLTLIARFLGCRVEVSRVLKTSDPGDAREYRWVYPAVQFAGWGETELGGRP